MKLSPLSEGYHPLQIFHREQQLQKINNTFEEFKTTGFYTNLFLRGPSGSGKTVLIKHIMQNYPGFYNYTSGAVTNTSLSCLRGLFGITSRNSDRVSVIMDGINK